MNASLATAHRSSSIPQLFDPRSTARKVPNSYDAGIGDRNSESSFDSFFRPAELDKDLEGTRVTHRDESASADDLRERDSYRLPNWSRREVVTDQTTGEGGPRKTSAQQPRPNGTADVAGRTTATPDTADVEDQTIDAEAAGSRDLAAQPQRESAQGPAELTGDRAPAKIAVVDLAADASASQNPIQQRSQQQGREESGDESAPPSLQPRDADKVADQPTESAMANGPRHTRASRHPQAEASAFRIANALIEDALSSAAFELSSVSVPPQAVVASGDENPGTVSVELPSVAPAPADEKTTNDAASLAGDAVPLPAPIALGIETGQGVRSAAAPALAAPDNRTLRFPPVPTASQSPDDPKQVHSMHGKTAWTGHGDNGRAIAGLGFLNRVPLQMPVPNDDQSDLKNPVANQAPPEAGLTAVTTDVPAHTVEANVGSSEPTAEPTQPLISLADGFRLSMLVQAEPASVSKNVVPQRFSEASALQPGLDAGMVDPVAANPNAESMHSDTDTTPIRSKAQGSTGLVDLHPAPGDAFVLELSSAGAEPAKRPSTSTTSRSNPASVGDAGSSPTPTSPEAVTSSVSAGKAVPGIVFSLPQTATTPETGRRSNPTGLSNSTNNEATVRPVVSLSAEDRGNMQGGGQQQESSSAPQKAFVVFHDAAPKASETLPANTSNVQVQAAGDEGSSPTSIEDTSASPEASVKVDGADSPSRVSAPEREGQGWLFRSSSSGGATEVSATTPTGAANPPGNVDASRANTVFSTTSAELHAENSDSTRLAASRMADPISELSVRPVATNKSITLRLDGPDQSSVDVRVTGRPGQVRVAVRTADTGLGTVLRQDLSTLVDSLARSGYHTQTGPRDQASAHSPSLAPSLMDAAGRELVLGFSSTGQADTGDQHGRQGNHGDSNGQGQHSGGQGSHSGGPGRDREGSGSGSNSGFGGQTPQQRKHQTMARWLASMKTQTQHYQTDGLGVHTALPTQSSVQYLESLR